MVFGHITMHVNWELKTTLQFPRKRSETTTNWRSSPEWNSYGDGEKKDEPTFKKKFKKSSVTSK